MLFRIKSKKGDGVFWKIAEIAIAIAVIIILFLVLRGQFTNFIKGLNSCEAKGGECFSSCGDLEPIPAGDAGCEKEFKNKDLVCCKVERKGEVEMRGYGANSQLIKVVVNKEKTPLYYGERRDFDIDKLYSIQTVLDYEKLKKLADTPDLRCSIFLKDVDTNEEYVLLRSKNKPSDTTSEFLFPISETYNQDDSFIISCGGGADSVWPRYFKPKELQAGRTYELRVVVYDKDVSNYFKPGTRMTQYSDDIKNAILDEENWLAEFTAYLRVKPIIEITGISGIWVASDDITVKSLEPYKLSKVEVGIIQVDKPQESDKISLYQKIYDTCSAPTTKYTDSLHKITAVKVGDEGINIIFPFARNAYQTASYESQAQPITVTETHAEIHLDASTIIEDFSEFKDDMLKETGADLKEYYLCVKALVSLKDEAPRTIYATSQQPLKLDVAPPNFHNTDDYIQVVYPDPKVLEDNLQRLIQEGRALPGQRITPIYFDEYPYIQIKKCIDKSGCKNYDYYFAPTNIRININTNTLGSGAVAAIIGYGLNYLYNYIVTRNPLKTLCPLANSGQYRRNSHPEIRFMKQQQGVFCIRVSDAVGNYWLTWKTVYNPYDVLENVAENVTGEITPVVGS